MPHANKHAGLRMGIMLFCLLCTASSTLAANPFTGAKNKAAPIRREKVPDFIVEGQAQLHTKLGDAIHTWTRTHSAQVFWTIMYVSFCYGIMHALGPGHRKTLVFSFYLTRNAPFWEPAVTSLALAALHSITSIILLFIFRNIRGALSVHTDNAALYMEGFSLILLILLSAASIIHVCCGALTKLFPQGRLTSFITAPFKHLLNFFYRMIYKLLCRQPCKKSDFMQKKGRVPFNTNTVDEYDASCISRRLAGSRRGGVNTVSSHLAHNYNGAYASNFVGSRFAESRTIGSDTVSSRTTYGCARYKQYRAPSRAAHNIQWGAFLLSGLYPCPASLLVLVLVSALDVFGIGILALVGISAGMALPITAAAYLAWMGRTRLFKRMSKTQKYTEIAAIILSLAAYGAIFFFSLTAAFPFIKSLIR